jgi:hypothetical protein
MSRAPHPLIDGLFAQAGTVAQMMLREQQTKLILKSIEGSLRLTDLGGAESIAGLMQVPLAEPASSGVLEATLVGADSPVQAIAKQLASALATSAPSHSPARPALTGSAAQTPSAALAKPAASMPVLRSTMGVGALPGTHTGALAGSMFPPEMLAAITAFSAGTPVRRNGIDIGPILAGMVKGLGAAGGPFLPSVHTQALSRPLALQTILEPALPLVRAALDRISGRDGTAPASHFGAKTPGRKRDTEPLAGLAPVLEWADQTFGPSARAVASALDIAPAKPPATLAGASEMGGLRGLAARSAKTTPSATSRLNMAHVTPTQAQRQQSNPADIAAPMVVTMAPLDDEHLARQLTRVLRREAQRDGIDMSDLQP